MKTIKEVRALTDEIAVRDLYLVIGYLSGEISVEDAISVCRCTEEMFYKTVNMAKQVAHMELENEMEIRDIFNGLFK